MSEHEVSTKLTLDDHASKGLEKLKSGFEHVGERVHEVQGELGGLLKQAAATAVGFQFDRGIESLKELGMEAFHAAAANEEQIKSLAGLVSMTDKSGMSIEELTKAGEGLKEELEAISIKAGATADNVIDAFASMAERSTKTKAQLVDMTDKMAMASRGLPGGMNALSGAFLSMEQGMVRPRNAIVQLLRTMGVVKGSSKEIAKGLSGMMLSGEAGKAKAFELADMAIGRMAEKMKNAPLTFQETINGLKTLRENIFEAMGGPMVKAITPALENVKKYMVQHKAEIEKYAETMGEKVGEWAVKAGEKVQEGFEYLKNHAKEIEEAISSGVKQAKQVLDFIIAHKEEIAIAYGVKAAAPSVIGGVKGAIGAGKAIAGLGSGGISMLGGAGTAGAGAGLAGAAMLVAATAAAAAAWYLVYDQAKKLYSETDGYKSEEQRDIDAKMTALRAIASKEGELSKQELADFARFSSEITNIGSAAGMNTAALGAMTQAIWDQRMAANATSNMLEGAAEAGDVNPIIAAYNKAEKENDLATQKYIATMLNSSEKLRFAFVDSGKSIEGGFEHLYTILNANSVEDIKSLLTMKKPTELPKAMNVNFNGGQAFNIKQDFRDQDPDRVIAVFRKDVVHSAASRLSANVSGGTGFF